LRLASLSLTTPAPRSIVLQRGLEFDRPRAPCAGLRQRRARARTAPTARAHTPASAALARARYAATSTPRHWGAAADARLRLRRRPHDPCPLLRLTGDQTAAAPDRGGTSGRASSAHRTPLPSRQREQISALRQPPNPRRAASAAGTQPEPDRTGRWRPRQRTGGNHPDDHIPPTVPRAARFSQWAVIACGAASRSKAWGDAELCSGPVKGERHYSSLGQRCSSVTSGLARRSRVLICLTDARPWFLRGSLRGM
jgi:hypothetical protein